MNTFRASSEWLRVAQAVVLLGLLMLSAGPQPATAQAGPVLLGNGQVWSVSNDGQYVILTQSTGAWVVPTAGGASVRLTPSDPQRAAISPTNNYVVVHGLPVGVANSNRNDARLWSIPLAGGTPIALSEQPIFDSGPRTVFRISADGRRVIYIGSRTANNINPNDLFSVPIDGSSAPVLLVDNTWARCFWTLSPDSQFVLFWFSTQSCSSDSSSLNIDDARVYRYPINGPASAGVPIDETGPGTYSGFVWTPDGRSIVYRRDTAIWRLNVASGTRTQVTAAGAAVGSWTKLGLSADGSRLIWNSANGGAIFSTPLAGPPSATLNLSAAMGPVYIGTSEPWVATASRRFVVAGSGTSLYAIPTDGSQQPVLIQSIPGQLPTLSPENLWGDALVVVTNNWWTAVPLASGLANATPLWRVGPHSPIPTQDGRWILAGSAAFGQRQLYAVPGQGGVAAATNETYGLPNFSLDGSSRPLYLPATQRVIVRNQLGGAVYAIQLGTGPRTARFSPECQGPPAVNEPPLPFPTSPNLLFLPGMGKCVLTQTSP